MSRPRVLGVLGGMAWPSTLAAYRQLNEGVAARLGGHHSAWVVIASVDFADVEAMQAAGDWEAAGALLAESARGLAAAGRGRCCCAPTRCTRSPRRSPPRSTWS